MKKTHLYFLFFFFVGARYTCHHLQTFFVYVTQRCAVVGFFFVLCVKRLCAWLIISHARVHGSANEPLSPLPFVSWVPLALHTWQFAHQARAC